MIAPYKDGVMQKMGFQEIRHEEHTSAHSRTAKLQHITKDTFKPRHHAPLLPLKACAGKDSSSPFYTRSPYGDANQYAHVNLWRQCMREDSWGYIDHAFLVGLVSPGQVLQHKDSKTYHLVTNMVDGKAALSINLVKKTINGITLLTWQQGPGLMPYSWVCVLRDDAYVTYRISHVGHAWRILYPQLCGGLVKSVAAKDFKGPYIKLDSGALTLHTGAAFKAYNKMGIAAMKGFAKDEGIEMPPWLGLV